MLSPSWRQVTHALLTRPPLSSSKITPKGSIKRFSLDLHVLGTPPAFVLSQDQTLEKIFRKLISSILNTNVFVKFAKTFLELTRSYTLCNCRNTVLFVLHITAFLTVYFSNISSQLAFFGGCSSSQKISTASHFCELCFLGARLCGSFFLLSRFERAYLSYHTQELLSTLFLTFFKIFLKSTAFLGATHLYYHISSSLSSTFFKFFCFAYWKFSFHIIYT